MLLPKKAIEEFKELYRKQFGIEINDVEASKKANQIIGLYKAVYGNFSLNKNEHKNHDSRRK